MFGFRIARHREGVEKRDRERWLAPTHSSNEDVNMHVAKTFLLWQTLYCYLNYFFFFFFCHKHYWNYTSCSYHQHAPIKTQILLSVVLGWTCLNHFSASLSTFISFLCRPWEYKRILSDTSSWKGVLFTVQSAIEATPGLLFSTPTTAALRKCLGEKKKL